jgi:predicted CoA-binding protein
MSCSAGGSDAQNQACGRQYAVVGAHDSSAQPSDSFRVMKFFMAHKCRIVPFDKDLLSERGIIGKLQLYVNE